MQKNRSIDNTYKHYRDLFFAYRLLVHDPWFTTTQKTNDRTTQTPLKLGTNSDVTEKVSSACSTCVTLRVIPVKNPSLGQEWGNNRIVITTHRTLQTFHSSQPGHDGDRKIFEVMITAQPLGTPGLLYPF